MLRPGRLFAGLAGAVALMLVAGPAATAQAAVSPDARSELLQTVQWGYYAPRGHYAPPPRWRPVQRCWTEHRRIAYRDRWGRIAYRATPVRVCARR